MTMCVAMLDMARSLRDLPWHRVEEILEGYRKALAKLDPRWDLERDCEFGA